MARETGYCAVCRRMVEADHRAALVDVRGLPCIVHAACAYPKASLAELSRCLPAVQVAADMRKFIMEG